MWAGKVPARHVIVLTYNLSLNPQSRVFAIAGGTPELQGWDTTATLLARLINTVLGLMGVKDESLFVKYPGAPEADEEMPYKTLAEFSEAGFMKRMGV